VLGDWPALGRLMNENHAIQRDLGGSGEPNERLIAAALQAGAPGAKLAARATAGRSLPCGRGPIRRRWRGVACSRRGGHLSPPGWGWGDYRVGKGESRVGGNMRRPPQLLT